MESKTILAPKTEWENLPSVVDGRFRVSRDGVIYRACGTGYVLANLTQMNNIKVVSYQIEKGKQKHCYAHRLVAEAYLPNPENHPCVALKVKNGDISADNLEWISSSERALRAAKENVKLCPVCNTRNVKISGKPCSYCASLERDKQQRAIKRKRKSEAIKKELQAALAPISAGERKQYQERNNEIIKNRMEGASLQEIAREYGLTRERVRQIIQTRVDFHDKKAPREQGRKYKERKRNQVANNQPLPSASVAW